MPFLPVAAREMREASRQARTYAWRSITAAVSLAVMGLVAWANRFSAAPAQGHNLFVAVSTAAFIYCLLGGVVRTADTISEEKRENTLGLLLLTDLKGFDILLGKLLSSVANLFFGLLALLPLLAAPMLMGGVSWAEFAKVTLSLLNSLFYAISWGLLISAIFRQSVVTISAGMVTMLFFGAVVPVMAIFCLGKLQARELATFFFFLTPVHTHVYSFANVPPGGPGEHYWMALMFHHAIGWLNLRLAIFFLPRLWQEVPKSKKTERWRERFRAWRFGKGKIKARFRTRLLNQNPLFWLANREQVSSMPLMVFAVVVLISGMMFGIGIGQNQAEPILVAWFFGLGIVHVTIAFRMAMSATQRLAEDRRTGALELLLGTEISEKEILRGQWMALGRQFFGPALIVLFASLFSLVMLLFSFSEDMRTPNLLETLVEVWRRIFRPGANAEASLGLIVAISIQCMLVLNWIAVIWVGMWLGLRERRSGAAMWFVLSLVYLPPWVLLFLGVIGCDLSGVWRGFRSGQVIGGVLTAGWCLGLAHLIILCVWARKNLHARFREAAADRYMARREFPWRTVARFSLRFAGCIVILLMAFGIFRKVVDDRGERLWRASLAAHPQFSLALPESESKRIPDRENLARAPILKSASDFYTTGRRPNSITWDLGRGNVSLPWDWTIAKRTDLVKIENAYLSQKSNPSAETTPAESVISGLSRYTNQLAELRTEARARPYTRYEPPPQYFFPPGVTFRGPMPPMPMPMWQSYFFDRRVAFRGIAVTLNLLTAANLAKGNASLDDIFLSYRLAEGFRDLPESSARYCEMIIDLTQPIYDGLTTRAWNDEQLKQIQGLYEGIDLWKNADALHANYARQRISDLERIVKSRRDDSQRQNALARQLPIGFLRQDEAALLEWVYGDLAKAIHPATRHIDLNALESGLATDPIPSNLPGAVDSFATATRTFAFTQITIDEVILACAIERYRRVSGHLPEKLEDLRPAYLAKVPDDVFTGLPLIYRPKADGTSYLIYGVGSDGRDNGGVAHEIGGVWSLQRPARDVDWVWNSESSQSEAAATPKKARRQSNSR